MLSAYDYFSCCFAAYAAALRYAVFSAVDITLFRLMLPPPYFTLHTLLAYRYVAYAMLFFYSSIAAAITLRIVPALRFRCRCRRCRFDAADAIDAPPYDAAPYYASRCAYRPRMPRLL